MWLLFLMLSTISITIIAIIVFYGLDLLRLLSSDLKKIFNYHKKENNCDKALKLREEVNKLKGELCDKEYSMDTARGLARDDINWILNKEGE